MRRRGEGRGEVLLGSALVVVDVGLAWSGMLSWREALVGVAAAVATVWVRLLILRWEQERRWEEEVQRCR